MLKTTARAKTITRCGLIKKDDIAKPNILSTFAESHHLIHSIDIFTSGASNLKELKEAFDRVKINVIPEISLEQLFVLLEPYFEKDYFVYGKSLGSQSVRGFCNICFLGDYCTFSLNKETRTQLGEFPQGYSNRVFNRFDVIIPISGKEKEKRKSIINTLKPILCVSSSFALLLEKESNFETIQTAKIQQLQTEISSYTNKFPNIHTISSDAKQNGAIANELHLWTSFNAISMTFQTDLTTKVSEINALSAKGIFPPSLLKLVFDKLSYIFHSNGLEANHESASILVRGFTDSAWSWGKFEVNKAGKRTLPHSHCRSAIGSGENSSTTFLSATEPGDALIFFTCFETDEADNYS